MLSFKQFVIEARDTHCSDECCGSDVKREDCDCPPTCEHCNCNAVDEACWDTHKQVGMKKKGDKMVPNCVKEVYDIYWETQNESCGYTIEVDKDDNLKEAEYQGRKVKLGKPMQGDVKKFKVYVRDPKTKNVKKVNFGDPNMRIKKSNPKRRKSFRARHKCETPGPKTKARYWSCKKW